MYKLEQDLADILDLASAKDTEKTASDKEKPFGKEAPAATMSIGSQLRKVAADMHDTVYEVSVEDVTNLVGGSK